MAKFEKYTGKDGLQHWRLKAANGEIVCWSEGYSSMQNVEKSIKWTKVNAHDASVVQL
jgi:uncharacterized protein YegP (UPF0339 family)